ncbi:MAG: hypothetical protein LBC55_03775, partial [Desulfovibrio sp.]|nr:hypothetical protein [Desulfovibrio sp.]
AKLVHDDFFNLLFNRHVSSKVFAASPVRRRPDAARAPYSKLTLAPVRFTAGKARLLLFRGKDLLHRSLLSSSFASFVNCSIV